ncbi:hypothetical protein [Chitinophaga nivalis]|uniref:DUF4919 domain-containing protein n=1 Tax=Chitinophaga nivalis TaxID=2991709 RepID=A0ABT3IWP0_9BACT|nr:hypothetical protein [Chitinophaga nivalis]MCW3461908.1 hypothetical protein [Chitinophaga nivalis]MCW3488401.1 hypothetical protein [Chitinophaga nivalis]
MKRIFLSLLFTGGLAVAAMAQSAQYESVMGKEVGELDSSKTYAPDVLQQKSNVFERIAAAEKNQWLPYYYAGYCEVMQALMTKDKEKIDGLADKAEANMDMAEALSPKNSEISCIRSLIATARLIVDPMTRGMKYGPESAAQLEQGKAYNPENPRVYMLQGQSLLLTPEQWGGDKVKGKATLELALQKFAAFKPESPIAPTWGIQHTRELLTKAK